MSCVFPARATTYYINDGSTNGDIYCCSGAVGSDANSGLACNLPKLTLTNLMATYTLAAGDLVYIDTGIYTNFTTSFSRSGSFASNIVFQGSTNYAAGGSIFDRRSSVADVFSMSSVSFNRFQDLTLRGGRYGVFLNNVPVSNIFQRVTVVSNQFGFAFLGGKNNSFRYCAAVSNGTGVGSVGGVPSAHTGNTWDQCVSWSNTVGFSIYSDMMSVSNSVIVGGTVFAGSPPDGADFNVYWSAALGPGLTQVSDIQRAKTNSFQSTVISPDFANPAGLDFHPRSVVGRYNPATGLLVTDVTHSAIIDFGDPSRPYAGEPTPNGARVNAGMFGNSGEASLSRTNPWLFAVSYNDGGDLVGTGRLYWTYGGFTNGATVRVQYSTDGGTTWTNIATGQAATNGVYLWNATSATASPRAFWRVMSETDTNVFDANNTNFVMRSSTNTAFAYYVNDSSTSGDMYTTAPGLSSNSGTTSNDPKRTVQDLLDSYDLGAGDTIYVDTGLYTNPVTILSQDQGDPGRPVIIQGSTKCPSSGTVFDRNSTLDDAFTLTSVDYVRLSDLTVRRSRYGVYLNNTPHSNEFVRVRAISNTVGFAFFGGMGNRFVQCTASRCTIGLGTVAGAQAAHVGNFWDQGVLWSNTTAMSVYNDMLSVSNSILGGGSTVFGLAAPLSSDYNIFYGAALGGGFNNLAELIRARTNGVHSTLRDPQFANPAGLDFHVRSSTGRYDPSSCNYVTTDGSYSPAIDFADPARVFTNEPTPNGSRLNAGPAGNTGEASKSRTNEWLLALSLQDGGQLSIGETVYWTGGGIPTSGTVRIELSGDLGQSWVVVATNLAASLGSYVWSNTNYPSLQNAEWRVVYEGNTNVLDATGQDPGTTNFVLRNGPFYYYMNDGSTTGDLYCSAVGSDTNLGTTAGSPKLTLTNLLATIDLEPGDVVYIDTGYYLSPGVPVVTIADSGVDTNPVIFVGSTNRAAGGSIFDRQNDGVNQYGLHFNGATFVDVRDLTITNAGTGFRIEASQGIRLTRTSTRAMRSFGYHIRNSPGTIMDRCVASQGSTNGFFVELSTGVVVRKSIAWRNGGAGIAVDQGSVAVSGSVVVASAPGASAYRVHAVSNVVANYNCIYLESNATAAVFAQTNVAVDTVAAWVALMGQDVMSLNVEPLFADPAKLDFHLQTQTPSGRYDPVLGVFVSDTMTSLLIDGGDPAGAYTNEPSPNGSRVNVGLFGNTVEASKGRTAPWLHAASLQGGGWVRGTATLHWVAGNFTNGATVRVDVSTNGGYAWLAVTSGILASAEAAAWNTTSISNTPACLWRVISLSDTNTYDQTTNFFAIRNGALTFYINDESISGDMFASGAGAATNWEASAARPFNSLAGAFRLYDVEPGDVLYVDTGYYTNDASIVDVRRPDCGVSGSVVRVIGSTNEVLGGSVIDRLSSAAGAFGLMLTDARWMSFSNITFRGGNVGVVVTNSSDITLSLRSVANASNGVVIAASTNIALYRAAMVQNGARGVVSIANTNVAVVSSVVWSNAGGAVWMQNGALSVSNSVLTASGGGKYIYEIVNTSDVLRADYNDLLAYASAQKALSGSRALKYLSEVQSTLGQDVHTLTHAPEFAAPENLDFHPRSVMGRYEPGVGIVTDAVTSPLIDTGDPSAPFGNEPSPNGVRVNIGSYGNDPQASRSRTNGWLLAVTLHDGGTIRGTNSLYWVAGGVATGHLVYIDASADGGVTWTNIATNVPASSGSFTNWDTTLLGSTLSGAWRITSQNDGSISDVVGGTNSPPGFALNNGALTYYVNDGSTNGDIYCSVPGSSANDGFSAGSPKASLQAILSSYTLSPGDRILVDTGTYPLNQTVTIDLNVVGEGTNYIFIQGSTNAAAGGSKLDGLGVANPAIDLFGTTTISIRDLQVINSRVGVRLLGATNCILERVVVQGAPAPQDAFGFDISRATNATFRWCSAQSFTSLVSTAGVRIRSPGSNLKWLQGIVWSNAIGIDLDGADLVVSNTIFGVFGSGRLAYSLGTAAILTGDYNDYWLKDGAAIAYAYTRLYLNTLSAPVIYDTVAYWARDTGRDRWSLSHDPAFFDPSSRDFHLMSTAGRYVPGTGFVMDAVDSPAIDAGAPSAAYSNEVAPNGKRLNLGIHGNTPEASLSTTNAGITVVSFNDGGVASGTNQLLYWINRGDATGDLLRVDFSFNGGDSFFLIASNLPPGTTTQIWNTTTWPSTLKGLWRVSSQTHSQAFDVSDNLFALRNSNFVFYVNDSSTNGDVYCENFGISTNTGLSRSSPLPSLEQLLNTYDVEPGDVIYVDTGVYAPTQAITIAQTDTGVGTNLVVIQGSTNEAAGGTVFTGRGLSLEYARSVAIRDLRFEMTGSGQNAVRVFQSTNVLLSGVSVRGAGKAFLVQQSFGTVMDRCQAVGCTTNGLHDLTSNQTLWQNGVLWSNKTSVLAAGSGLTVSNSLLGSMASGQLAYDVSGTLTSDYNNVFATNSGQVAQEFVAGRVLPLQYVSVSRWAKDRSRELHSLSHDPLVAAVGTDFHLRSQGGRYVSSNGLFVADTVTSPMIDAGDPVGIYTNETSPNGGRVNMGRYGDTPQASRTPTNASLLAVSLNDGGLASGTNELIYWIARGDATGYAVRIEYSGDGGVTWTNLATNLPAGASSYAWNTTNTDSTVLGLYRIVAENYTNVRDQVDQLFAVRNGPVKFYVNDGSTNGDVYTSVPGSNSALGVSASKPKASIAGILDAYDLEPGDIIYVDTGTYSTNTALSFGQLDAGSAAGPRVIIQGSTNGAAGGTVLARTDGGIVVDIFDGSGLDFRNLTISGGDTGVRLQRSNGLRFTGVTVIGGSAGFNITQCDDAQFLRCVARNVDGSAVFASDATGAKWESGVLWSNRVGLQLVNSSFSFSNSVVGVFGDANYAFSLDSKGTFNSEYNDLFVTNRGRVALQSPPVGFLVPLIYETPSRWTRATGRDRFTLSQDPLFGNPAAGDFHPRSAAGRYVPSSASYTNDAETSPLLDAGSPFCVFTNEPAPNGGRLDIGLYGNSGEASLVPTNGRLVAVSINDRGRAEGSAVPLYWLSTGASTADTVRVEVSTGTNGAWSVVASNLSARPFGPYFWDSTAYPSTIYALWRVVDEINTSVVDAVDAYFAIRNNPLAFYVNDNDTVGDVYTTSAGSPAFDGAAPSRPASSIQDVLDRFDLEPGDFLYVDTGSFTLENKGILVDRFDAWDDVTNMAPLAAGQASLTIQGSTNDAFGGTTLSAYQTPVSIVASQAYGLAVRALTLTQTTKGSGIGLEVLQSPFATVSKVMARDGQIGFFVSGTQTSRFDHCIALGNKESGLATLDSRGTSWRNGVLWSNTYGVLQNDSGGGTLLVRDSIIGSLATGKFAYISVKGAMDADYNGIYRTNGGFCAGIIQGGNLGGGTTRYEYVASWVAATTNDRHSLPADPVFADIAGGDFHLRSPAGRYVSGSGYMTNAAELLSPMMDLGDPASDYSQETMPNGGRVNIGRYGNTGQSSLSPTNGLLAIITFNDGGTAEGIITLRWGASGSVTGQLVRLEFSSDGGASWTNIQSNVVASAGQYVWNSTPYGRAAAGLWRIVSQSDPSVFDVSDRFFALRNGGSIPYYVNDASTVCDIYCSAPGNDLNDGYLTNTPKRTIQALIDSIDLEPGDIVYVDTGNYLIGSEILIGDLDAGTATNHVIFQGSTNYDCGGTVIDRQTGFGSGIHVFETQGIEFRDVRVINAAFGVNVEKASSTRFVGVRADNCPNTAFTALTSDDAVFDNCVAAFCSNGLTLASAGVTWKNGIVWGNQQPISVGDLGALTILNSVIQAVGTNARIYALSLGASFPQGDYNNVIRQVGALMAEQVQQSGGNNLYGTLTDWQAGTGRELHTLAHDPLFVDGNAGDFHLRSAAGRFLLDGSMTNDSPGTYSPMLDTGNPSSTYTNERPPNGGRVNMGIYGDTTYASLSQTNPWLLAVSFNDGGLVRGTVTVYWVAGGMASGATVRLEQAPNGVDFTPFATNIPASRGTSTWDVSQISVTKLAKWRVSSETYPGVMSEAGPFLLKPGTLTIYVNDDSTNGDVYCTAIGSCTNSGRTPSQPLCDPAYALQKYDLGPDDIVYVDTGVYNLTNSAGMVLGLIGDFQEKGVTDFPIHIIGSYNNAAGGSRIVGTGAGSVCLNFHDTRYIELANLRFTGADVGVVLANIIDAKLSNVQCYANSQRGFQITKVAPLTMDRCATWNNGGVGLSIDSQSQLQWNHGVVWSNTMGGMLVGNAGVSISNSLLGCENETNYIFLLQQSAVVLGDYNFFSVSNGAFLARDQVFHTTFKNLRAWQVARSTDEHSAPLDPLMIDPGLGDFHLRSKAGAFDVGTGAFLTNDTDTSWAIDAGPPAHPFALEPDPNGARVNVGIHGNTAEGSHSVTSTVDRAVKAVTLNDGGLVTGPITFRWLSRAYATGDLVSVEVSQNGGVTWFAIATNISALQGEVNWVPAASNATPVGLWRVCQNGDCDQNDVPGPFRPIPVKYYVNDDGTGGDIYAIGSGNDAYTGLTAFEPKRNVQAILDQYDLEAGDIIYVDTGVYAVSNDIQILNDDSGVLTSRVVIVGSTNYADGGTVFDRGSTNKGSDMVVDAVFNLFNANFIDISHVKIRNANVGILLNRSSSCIISNVDIYDGGLAGIELQDASANDVIQRAVITRQQGIGIAALGGGGNFVDSCVIWSNGSHAINITAGSIYVSNSVLHAADTNFCYVLPDNAVVLGDYNDLHTVAGAHPGKIGTLTLEGLPQWVAKTTQDVHSLNIDPMFVNPSNLDFHVRSVAGRFDPGTQSYVLGDTNFSLLIDTGGSNSTYAAEPSPNGARRNIGRYGDTKQASKSNTNQWLLAITASSGGRAGGAFYLVWSYGGMAPTNKVRLDFSYDNGTNWVGIATNLAVGSGQYLWNSLLEPLGVTPIARWRVVSETDTNVADVTDDYFGLNSPFRFYVNDTNLVGDVYCAAPGDDMNLGIYSNSPKRSLAGVFESWDLDPGDEVLVDTGQYPISSNDVYTIERSDEGATGNKVKIHGSTNGSTFVWIEASPPFPLLDIGGSEFEVTDLRFLGGGARASGTNVLMMRLVLTNADLEIFGPGGAASDIRIDHGVLKASGANGDFSSFTIKDGRAELSGSLVSLHQSVLNSTQGVLVIASGTNITLRNNTMVSSRTAVQQIGSDSSLILRNNIIVANGAGGGDNFVIQRGAGTLDSDYNDLVARNNAWIGNANGYWERLLYWQRASGLDTHSIAAEPDFANEAAGDFHLRSLIGRYTASGFTTDVSHSSAIDMGVPSDSFANETAPNGSRVNLGAYGDTVQASRSRTNSWLTAITMNDSGVLKGTNTIRWATGNIFGGTVTLRYSPDNGVTWTNFATGVAALAGQYEWDTTQVTSSLFALWGVVLDADTNVFDNTDASFAVRNSPLGFYVNDSSSAGDMYCSALGASTNDGLTASKPKASLSGILSAYDTEGGDVIYVDTGSYALSQNVNVIWSRGGDPTNGPLVIVGSTNAGLGGTVLRRGNTSAGNDAVDVHASYVTLRNLIVKDGYRGVSVDSNRSVTVERMLAVSNEYGIAVVDSQNAKVRNVRFWNNRQGGVDVSGSITTTVENCTFYGNQPFAYRTQLSSKNILQNSIFAISTTSSTALAGTLADIFLDYNVYQFVDANAAIYGTNKHLLNWQLGTAHDYRSAITNPEMASASAGDFHLKSTLGRYVDGVGWTTDAVDSWAIDRGSTNAVYANEPLPNGNRINIGAYGNTEFASLGRTNSQVLVETRILNTPTHIDETNAVWPLIWTSINVPTTELFRVEYSPDNGMTWYVLSNNVPAYQEYIIWNTSPFFNSYRARWRVVGINNTNYWDINDAPFDLFYGQFKINSEDYGGLTNRFVWRGAWAEYYQVQYSTNIISTNAMAWRNAVNGPLANQKANFFTTNGGDFLYADPESVTNRQRHYRVLWQQF